ILAVLVPLLGLLGLLLAAQLTFWRRFQRRINPWLLLATGLLLATAAISAGSAVAQHRLDVSRGTLQQLVTHRQQQGSAAEANGLQALSNDLVRDIPTCAKPSGCGYTVGLFGSYVNAVTARSADSVDDSQLTRETDQVGSKTAAAAAGAGL